jgi:fructose-1,6-bisphosphatase
MGDVHFTVMVGGVFGYPADTKSPNGNFRLVYDWAPMSFTTVRNKRVALNDWPRACHGALCLAGTPARPNYHGQ